MSPLKHRLEETRQEEEQKREIILGETVGIAAASLSVETKGIERETLRGGGLKRTVDLEHRVRVIFAGRN